MAHIRLRIELNKGGEGAPLEKLGGIARQLDIFLCSLAEDLSIKEHDTKWVAKNFENHSVSYDAVLLSDVSDAQFHEFNKAVEKITDFDPRTGIVNGLISARTLSEYSKLGEFVEPDEVVGVGLYVSDSSEVRKWKNIGRNQASAVQHVVGMPIRSYGSVQGIVHAVTPGAQPPFFRIRELSTGELIRCEYTTDLHSDAVDAIRTQGTVVHVGGHMIWDRAQRSIEKMTVDRIIFSQPLTDEDFQNFCGSIPEITDDLTTEEFVDEFRKDV